MPNKVKVRGNQNIVVNRNDGPVTIVQNIYISADNASVNINSDRFRRAKEFFDNGEIGNSRGFLEGQVIQMNIDQSNLLARKDDYETKILPKLKHNSQEFFFLAMMTQTCDDVTDRIEKTCKYFEAAIRSHPNPINIFHYAMFLQENNQMPEAEEKYLEVLKNFPTQLKDNVKSATMNNLANLHWVHRKPTDSLEEILNEYEKALEIRRELAVDNPNTYLPDVATILNNLANVHREDGNLEDSIASLDEAAEIRQNLGLPEASDTSNNVNLLILERMNYDEALE